MADPENPFGGGGDTHNMWPKATNVYSNKISGWFLIYSANIVFFGGGGGAMGLAPPHDPSLVMIKMTTILMKMSMHKLPSHVWSMNVNTLLE